MKNKVYLKKLWIAGLLTTFSLIVMIVALLQPQKPKVVFTPPSFAETAVQGSPDVQETYEYTEFYQQGMAYRVKMNATVSLEGTDAIVYFTNPSENNAWLRLRIMDETGAVLGESGILRPGEYIRSVTLSRTLPVGASIHLKVMGYEPETYHSIGAVTINSIINEKTTPAQ